MPVASFVAPGTACGRLRSRLARKGCFLPHSPSILPPTRFFKGTQAMWQKPFTGGPARRASPALRLSPASRRLYSH